MRRFGGGVDRILSTKAPPHLGIGADRRSQVRGLVWAAAAGVLFFPAVALHPEPSTDPSWQAGLVMAATHRLEFGREFVFTYGPLGFLAHPVLWGTPSLAAIVLTVVVLFGIVALGTRWLANRVPLPVAAVASALAVALGWAYEPSIATPLQYTLVGYALVRLLRSEPARALVVAMSGVGAGLLLLTKFDSVAMSVLSVVAIAGTPFSRRRVGPMLRSAGLAVGSAFVAVVACWALLGQPLGALPTWLRLSWEIARGFNEAMVFRRAPFSLGLPVLATLVLLAGAFAAVRRRRCGLEHSLAAVGFLAGVLWFGAKSGFVRFDGHAYRYLGLLLVLAVALYGAGERRTGARRLWPATGVGVVVTVVWLAAIPGGAGSLVRPWSGPSRLVAALSPLVSGSTRSRITREGTDAILTWADLPPSYADALRGAKRVHAEGEDIALLWALGLGDRWDPNPVIQSYSAYTGSLDSRNAAHYRDEPSAPDVVLYHSVPGDGHHPRFQSPATIVALLCNYDPLPAEGTTWQLLQRVEGRCGEATDERVVNAKLGSELAWTTVPADEESIVIGTFDLDRGLTDQLLQTLRLRPGSWTFQLGGWDGGAVYRFDPDTAVSPHLLGVPACMRAWLPRFDTRTYNPITIGRSDSAPSSTVTLRVRRLPYRCP